MLGQSAVAGPTDSVEFAENVALPDESAPSTLEECIQGALAKSASTEAADREVAVRDARARALRARLLPVLRTEAKLLLWNDDFVFDRFSRDLGPLFAPMIPAGGSPPSLDLEVRDDLVFTFQASVIEPLGKIYQVYAGQAALFAMKRAAEHDAETARRKLMEQVVLAYFNHLSAVRMRDTVRAALDQVDAIDRKTEEYVTTGLLERDSLLKVRVQRRDLERARLQADKATDLTRATLNMLMRRPLDAKLVLVEPKSSRDDPAQMRLLSAPISDLQREAIASRPELRAAREQLEAGEHGTTAKLAAMLPDVNAIAAYQRNEGMGEFMPKDAAFVGLALEWNVFEWGAQKYAWDEAKEELEKARAMVEAARDGIQLEVHERRLDLEESRAQSEVARAELDLAEENLRMEQARYDVRNTTATDLLQAQTTVIKAKNELTVASMRIEASYRRLAIAMGRDVTHSAGGVAVMP